MVYFLQAKMKIFVARRRQNGGFFEEVKISQQRNGVLLTSFYIFLHSSTPFRWWCYLNDSPSGLGCELFSTSDLLSTGT